MKKNIWEDLYFQLVELDDPRRASLVWPKLVWPNARLAETHLAESSFDRKMAEIFKNGLNKA
jgi:hypothetical protein